MEAQTIALLTGSLLKILDMVDRMQQRFPDPEAREQYIEDRNEVRRNLMGLADDLRGPQEPAGDDPAHGYRVPDAGQGAGQDASGDIPDGGSTPSESGDPTA